MTQAATTQRVARHRSTNGDVRFWIDTPASLARCGHQAVPEPGQIVPCECCGGTMSAKDMDVDGTPGETLADKWSWTV